MKKQDWWLLQVEISMGICFMMKKARERIAEIKFYQQLGFSIKEISDIIDASNVVVKNALERQVQKLVEEKIQIDYLIERANQIITKLEKENHN